MTSARRSSGTGASRPRVSWRTLYVTDGGSGLRQALRERYGKKLVHQRCAVYKARTCSSIWQVLPQEAHRKLTTSLEQTSKADARHILLELEVWLRTKESAVESLLEAFEELLTVHRLKVSTLLSKALMSTNPNESMFSLIRHSERSIKRTRGSAMLQR